MTTTFKLCFLSLLFLFVSCVKQNVEELSVIDDPLSDVLLTVSDTNLSTNDTLLRVHGDIGKYASYFKEFDARIGISSSRFNQNEKERVIAYYDVNNKNTKAHFTNTRKKDVKVNGLDLFSPSTKALKGSVENMFGKEISFDFSEVYPSTKGNTNSVSMYVPTIIRVTCPKPLSNSRTPLCYYKDFVVRWNADQQNKNGVMVVIRWTGSVLFGRNYSSMICHSICVQDNGETVLDESMFEGIPDTAYCSMYLVRGNVEDIDVDQIDYQLLAETHDIANFILIRKIKQFKK